MPAAGLLGLVLVAAIVIGLILFFRSMAEERARAAEARADRLEQMRPLCDGVVCLLAPEDFSAVGQFYDEFGTVEDDEVVRILREAAPFRMPAGGGT